MAAYGAGAHGGAGHGGKGTRGGKPKKGGPWKVVFWVALVVLVVALVALGAIAFSYWQGQSRYDAVAEEVFTPPTDIENASLSELSIDWDKLKAINPETVGWVYIPGTAVNYPIVHTSNDDKYLTTDFDGKQAWGATYGSIFLAAANAATFTDANNLVYGHNLNNGSMFAAIMGLDNADQFNAHRTVYILTPQGNYKLTTFSLVHCEASDPLAQTAFADDAERIAYVQDKIDRSVIPASGIPAAADIKQMFAFATCDNLPTDGRYVLFASIAESTAANQAGASDAAAVAEGGAVDPNAAEAVNDASKELAA